MAGVSRRGRESGAIYPGASTIPSPKKSQPIEQLKLHKFYIIAIGGHLRLKHLSLFYSADDRGNRRQYDNTE